VRGHYAAKDDFFPADAIKALEAQLQGMGKDVELEVHPGSGHAYMNDANVLGTYDAGLAATCWSTTADFLRQQLR
jgi:carboxymethylenebutenolidase